MLADKQLRWQLQHQPPAQFIRGCSGLSPVTATILYNRGHRTKGAVAKFLNLEYDEALNDPRLLPDINKAVARLRRALANKEKIAVYGDYDADGVCAATLLVDFLEVCSSDFIHYLPDRELEGYGLNRGAIEGLAKAGAKLVITVDCGTSNVNEVSHAKKLGLDVIVLDHHEAPKVLPKAIAIVNPKRSGSKYPFRDLAGTGVVFKFICAAHDALKNKIKLPTHWLKWQLDIVALATVADRMPLVLENRVLVAYGLKVINKTRRVGLKALISVSGLGKREITATDLGFALAPRVNAAGRMDHANAALFLLRSKNVKESMDLAAELQKANQARQRLVERILKQINHESMKPKGLLMAFNEQWPKGILGLVASKLVNMYDLPCIVGQRGKDVTVASGRSLEGYDLIAGLKRCRQHLINFGGHTYAAGFSVRNKDCGAFIRALSQDVLKHRRKVEPVLKIDAKVLAEDLTPRLFDEILALGPFGEGNPVPLLQVSDALITHRRSVGSNANHLQLLVRLQNNTTWKAMAFQGVKAFPESGFGVNKEVAIAFEPMINEWQGRRNYELRILDIKNNIS